jgi:hypothetical protein
VNAAETMQMAANKDKAKVANIMIHDSYEPLRLLMQIFTLANELILQG